MGQMLRTYSHSETKPPRNPRFRVDWSLIALKQDGSRTYGRVVDISTTGLQMQIPLPALLGMIVEVEIWPSPDACIKQSVKVVRLHSRAGNLCSYGARILANRAAQAQASSTTILHDILLRMRRAELAPDFARKRY